MKFTIHNGDDDLNLLPFINSEIIPLMQLYLRSHIDKQKLEPFRQYINIDNFLMTLMRTNFVVCRKFRSDYVVEINSNLYMRNSFAKLIDMCYLVNYGNVECQSYPIFTQMFAYIKREFSTLYKLYFDLVF